MKSDFKKLENSQSYEEKFGQLNTNFLTYPLTTLRKNFVFFYNVPNKIQVFALIWSLFHDPSFSRTWDMIFQSDQVFLISTHKPRSFYRQSNDETFGQVCSFLDGCHPLLV
jgi:hypothetical protein